MCNLKRRQHAMHMGVSIEHANTQLLSSVPFQRPFVYMQVLEILAGHMTLTIYTGAIEQDQEMPSREAFVGTSNGTLNLTEATLEPLDAGFVRIRPKAVAINPTDYKHLTLKASVGAVAGCDFAGVVTEIGPGTSGVEVGQTVAGGVTGARLETPDVGAYSTVIRAYADSLYKFDHKLVTDTSNHIPEGPVKSFEQASSLGIGIGTAAIASAWYNKVPVKKNSAKGWFLVYGAAGSLGFHCVQLFKWMGYDVIAVASRKHEKLFKELGIKHLIDYHDSDWPEQVRKIAGDDITRAYDTIALGETFEQVSKAVSKSKSVKINCSLPPTVPDNLGSNISYDVPLWYMFWQESFDMAGWHVDGSEELRKERAGIHDDINTYIADSNVKSLPITVAGDGFNEIPKAMDVFAQGTSAEKVVVRE